MYNSITVKIGSNVLTRSDGMIDESHIAGIVEQLVTIRRKGINILLVSSGAVASGRQQLPCHKSNDPVSCRQLWAAVGQVKLMNIYSHLFSNYGMLCSQVLVTKEDFRDRRHFLNTRNSLETLLDHDIIPVINENDVVSVTELMFTDNDELASLLSSMMKTDAMIIMSNVDGIYNGDPSDPDSEVIPVIDQNSGAVSKYIAKTKSSFGRGGMITKFGMARKVADAGIPVHLVNGKRENILVDIIDGKPGTLQTFFRPAPESSQGKKWLTHSAFYSKGEIHINEGAYESLSSDKASSLLPVGVTAVKGNFMKGDIVRIINHEGKFIGLGKTQYSSETAGKKIGEHNAKPVVHYDYLYLRNDD
jgi:glutamate 5-kinase